MNPGALPTIVSLAASGGQPPSAGEPPRARAFVFGDHVTTDEITPGRFNVTVDPAKLADACFREARPSFRTEVERGDVIVAGENFGCGSSRESAPRAILASGIQAVVAESYARIFYRNAVNVGLPVLTANGISAAVEDGEAVTLALEAGSIETPRGVFSIEGADGLMAEIVDAGGIVPYVARQGVQL